MKNKVASATRRLMRGVKHNSPAIFMGLGVVGFGTTVAFAIRATPEAERIIAHREVELDRQLTNKEIIGETWKLYLPTLAMGTISVGCFIGANKIQAKRYTALAGLYSITEKSLTKYQDKIVETFGEGRAQKIKDEITQDIVTENPPKTQVIFNNSNEMLCYDKFSGRYFPNDIQQIRTVENDLYREILRNDYISLNSLYMALGLDANDMGDYVGWNIDQPLKIEFSTMLSDKDVPCLVLEFRHQPFPEFDRFA